MSAIGSKAVIEGYKRKRHALIEEHAALLKHIGEKGESQPMGIDLLRKRFT